MSARPLRERKTSILDIQKMYREGQPFSMVTAYDYALARLVDAAGIEMILVGDSLGMVMMGLESTVPVTMEEMLHHCRSVARGAGNTFLVGDMPFMSYQVSREEAVRNAGRIMKEGGMDAIKLEGGQEVAALVGFSALGMGMEWYNTAAGHWTYPDTGLFALGDVPLFVGAMYAAVGVCVLRMIRIFEMRFVPFPPLWPTLGLTLAIYVNFFTQHVWIDLRLGLMVATVLLFGRTWIVFIPAAGRRWRMPMLLSLALSALGVWLAENLGTLTGTWLPHRTLNPSLPQSPGATPDGTAY